jgi:hypothetical protein
MLEVCVQVSVQQRCSAVRSNATKPAHQSAIIQGSIAHVKALFGALAKAMLQYSC